MMSAVQAYLYDDLYQLEETHWWHLSKRALVKEALEELSIKPNAKILDIGCGTGKTLEFLTQIYPQSHGVDVSSKAIEFCQKRGLKKVKKSSASKLPFPANTFDVITMLDVLEHTQEDKTLKEVYRVLKPGGVVLITVPAFSWLWSQWDVVLHHYRRYTKGTLQKVMSEYSFQTLKTSYLYAFLVLPILLIRKLKSKLLGSSKTDYESDFKINNQFTNLFFAQLSAFERKILWKIGLPLGSSLVGIFKKV